MAGDEDDSTACVWSDSRQSCVPALGRTRLPGHVMLSWCCCCQGSTVVIAASRGTASNVGENLRVAESVSGCGRARPVCTTTVSLNHLTVSKIICHDSLFQSRCMGCPFGFQWRAMDQQQSLILEPSGGTS